MSNQDLHSLFVLFVLECEPVIFFNIVATLICAEIYVYVCLLLVMEFTSSSYMVAYFGIYLLRVSIPSLCMCSYYCFHSTNRETIWLSGKEAK